MEDSAPMPPYHIYAAADFGEPGKTSHISKTVLSIVKFDGATSTPMGPMMNGSTLPGYYRAMITAVRTAASAGQRSLPPRYNVSGSYI